MNLRARAARFVSALRPPAPSSAFAVVDRGLATFVIVWQALWMLATPSFWPFATPSLVVALAVGLTRATLVVMLYAHLRGSARARTITRWLNVVTLAAATVVLVIVTSHDAQPDWRAVATFALLPCAVAGLLFAVRPAIVVMLGVVAAEIIAVFSPFSPDIRTNVPADALYPAFALAAGVVAIVARHVLVRDARSTDAVLATTAAVEQERRTSEGVEQAIMRRERLLHESVLNTLTAIERGGLTASPGLRARLVARSRESARTLRELLEQAEPATGELPASGRLDRDLGGPLVDLSAAGVAVNADCDVLDQVPSPVYSALRSAAREALSNVNRHAEAHSVWLTARQARRGSDVRASVTVRDDGSGFNAAAAGARYGLPVAITRTMVDVGGTAVIESAQGVGTQVQLGWDNTAERSTRSRRPATSGFAVPILATFALFTVASIGLSWADYSAAPLLNIIALALYLGLATLLGWESRRGVLRWPIVAVVLALSPLVYVLQGAATGNIGSGGWSEWSSIAIASLFLVIAGAGPPWAWLAALCTWLVVQGDIVAEILSAGTAILVAGAVFGRSLRRNASRLDNSAANQVIQRSSLAVARESTRRIQQRYALLRVSDALGLLTGIADGSIDADDPDVRRSAAVEERFVRTVLRVDPTVDAVQALVASLAVRARRRGLLLDTDVVSAAVDPTSVEAVTSSLVAAVQSATSGETARLSTRIEGRALAIRLLVPIETGEREAMQQLPVGGMPLGPGEPGMLWEIVLPVSGQP